MLTKEIADRVNLIDEGLIHHSQIRAALDGIKRCIIQSSSSKEPVNFLLTGISGTGKSSTCETIVNEMQRESVINKGCKKTIIPAFYCELPKPTSIKGVASAMLSSMGDIAPTRGTGLELTYRLKALLKHCETEVIILDEFHHLLEQDLGKRDDVKDWIKSLINLCKIPIVLVGTPNCIPIIQTDKQLARRYNKRLELKNFSLALGDPGQFDHYVFTLLKTYKNLASLKSFPDFSIENNILSLYIATGGNPDDITTLLKGAVTNSLEHNREEVTLEDFYHSYNTNSLPNSLIDKLNPFGISQSDLLSLIDKKRSSV